MPLSTYQETIDALPEGTTPSILLGNGFSQSWDTEIFRYDYLLDRANFGERDAEIKDIFRRFETSDFEQIMKNLIAAEVVGDAYGIDADTLEQIRDDQEKLKESLIDVISRCHPLRPSEITNEQFRAVRSFLRGFQNIFTLNYDILLYWAINKTNREIDDYRYLNKTDGFDSNYWSHDRRQNLFFVHGGLHLYDTGTDIKKHVYYRDERIGIVDQVQENLDAGKFPLFVSEPSHEKKLHKIEHNPYLNRCYQALKSIDGTLYIHGHSMDDNDMHIFQQIKGSGVSKVYVGIFGDPNNDHNTRARANALAFLQRLGLEVEFYDAATAPIWA
ncbi:DUF4917 family protein [Shewanella sp. 10N.286.45.A1]|uniref:DUF4917 family protein n=1 Tax=Shewanella sp. 10N.286.45.A1 TaxID=3229694 RepID=UPI00354F9601